MDAHVAEWVFWLVCNDIDIQSQRHLYRNTVLYHDQTMVRTMYVVADREHSLGPQYADLWQKIKKMGNRRQGWKGYRAQESNYRLLAFQLCSHILKMHFSRAFGVYNIATIDLCGIVLLSTPPPSDSHSPVRFASPSFRPCKW